MKHLVLLGDSVFDNAAYVQGGLSVIDQVRARLPLGSKASLLAVDGDTASAVHAQLQRLPDDATHLVLSAGGNDALGCLAQLELPITSVKQALVVLAKLQNAFRDSYARLMASLVAFDKPTLVCTIYDSVPGMPQALQTALSLFNDVIVREAMRHQWPVLDLREVLTEPADYSVVSPIEPSSAGGEKLARQLLAHLIAIDR
jgi:hypothetical protein